MDCYLLTVLAPGKVEPLQTFHLDCAMSFRDFDNEIYIDGTLHRLPPFEYTHEATASAETVLRKARRAAKIAGVPNARIFLARITGGWTDRIVA